MKQKQSTWFSLCLCSLVLLLFIPASGFGFHAQFGVSPDNSGALLQDALRSAKNKLLINIYEFENKEIANTIVEQIKAGVAVELLVEGEPVTPLSAQSQKIIKQIRTAMEASSRPSQHHLFLMRDKKNGSKRRFRFDHAKYAVIDSRWVLVSSENFTDSGHPKPGKIGNRGWETLLDSPSLSNQMADLFYADADPSQNDIVEVTSAALLPAGRDSPESNSTRPLPAFARGEGEVHRATIITSPLSLKPIVDMIRSARSHLELEHMSMPPTWLDLAGNRSRNPIVNELIAAADRGVTVRVVLNDEWAFVSHPPAQPRPLKNNEKTVVLLEDMARCYDLPIAARIVDTKAAGISYIHNKGLLADSERVLVSSINGTQNSVVNNREVAVLLDSSDAGAYFGDVFDFDWSKSVNLDRRPDDIPATACPPKYESPIAGFLPNTLMGLLAPNY